MLGPHPRDKAPVELHAGRYGPYVKHGDVNATLPDKDKMDSLTLEEAVALLDEKAGKSGGATKSPEIAGANPRSKGACGCRSTRAGSRSAAKARDERNAEARSRRGAQAHHALDGGHCRTTAPAAPRASVTAKRKATKARAKSK